jgi:large subunit ribosomal protein L3
MGGVQRTVQNLRVVSVDPERQMILVGGAVPGTNEGYVVVKTSKKKG